MISVNDLRPGFTFKYDNNIYVVIEASHSKQGRGQAKAMIDKINMDYLYNAGDNIILMDQETFEQIEIPVDNVKWELNFLKEGQKVQVRKFESEVLDIELPANVELKVVSAPDAVRGNTAQTATKKVTLETDYVIETPLFIKEGEVVLVSTETGKYVGRA